jgi:hypothetical protein
VAGGPAELRQVDIGVVQGSRVLALPVEPGPAVGGTA